MDFFFLDTGVRTANQGGQTLNLYFRYRCNDGLAVAKNPNYLDLRADATQYLNAIDTSRTPYWEVLTKTLCTRLKTVFRSQPSHANSRCKEIITAGWPTNPIGTTRSTPSATSTRWPSLNPPRRPLRPPRPTRTSPEEHNYVFHSEAGRTRNETGDGQARFRAHRRGGAAGRLGLYISVVMASNSSDLMASFGWEHWAFRSGNLDYINTTTKI